MQDEHPLPSDSELRRRYLDAVKKKNGKSTFQDLSDEDDAKRAMSNWKLSQRDNEPETEEKNYKYVKKANDKVLKKRMDSFKRQAEEAKQELEAQIEQDRAK